MASLALLGAAPADTCADLARASSPTLEIVSAARDGAVCRVEAIARPRPDANIAISLWLPPASRWSGRYYQMGNGGFAGKIDRATLAAAAARGDAAAATDTGHHGDGFEAGWARGRPDLVRDYAWASIKTTADTAAALTSRFYGHPARRRYFMGCSFGGRQALVAASRWPGDWDGVIAGAPAIDWLPWLAGFARLQHLLRASPANWIDPGRLPFLIAVARRSPRSLGDALAKACRAGDRLACLSPSEARSVAAIEQAGYRFAAADATEWRRWILNDDPGVPSQARFATEAYRALFADRPDWSLADYRSEDGPPDALREEFAVGSLGPFLAQGGKVLSYVGTADAVLPPGKIVVALHKRVPPMAGGFRLLIVPGMAHCQGGATPNAFGQSLGAPAARDDRYHDIRRALESWVERGKVPDRIVVTSTTANGHTRMLRLRR